MDIVLVPMMTDHRKNTLHGPSARYCEKQGEPYRDLQPTRVLSVIPEEGDGLYRGRAIQPASQVRKLNAWRKRVTRLTLTPV